MPDTAAQRPVLVTRTAPGASETAGRLQQLGLHPVVSPMLDLAARDVALPALDAYEGLIFTSASCRDLYLISNHKGGIETDTKLADQVDIIAGVLLLSFLGIAPRLRQRIHERLGA